MHEHRKQKINSKRWLWPAKKMQNLHLYCNYYMKLHKKYKAWCVYGIGLSKKILRENYFHNLCNCYSLICKVLEKMKNCSSKKRNIASKIKKIKKILLRTTTNRPHAILVNIRFRCSKHSQWMMMLLLYT